MSVCKYDWSYYYWSLYCNLTIVMIRKYLKSNKSWSIVWIFAMTPNFSYFTIIKKIVISMLNCYCREYLIFYAFCGTDIRAGAQYATFTCGLSRCINWVVGDSFYNTIFEFYTHWKRSESLCGNNFVETIFKFLHSIKFT